MEHSSHNLLQAGSQTAISDRMRELLARAAQDHVYEQRTQGAVLDEIRQRLEGMEWLLREVRERELGGLGGALETISGRLDEMASRPPEWAEGLAREVELLRDRVEAAGGQTQGLTDRMTEFARRLAQFQTSMEAAAGRFTRLDKALAQVAERADRLEAVLLDRLDTLDGRVDAVSERVGRLPTELEIGELRTAVADLGSAVEGMGATVAAGVAGLSTGVSDVTAGVDEMSTTVAGMHVDLSAATGSLAPLVEAVRSRPDREQLTEAVSGAVARIVEPAHGDVARRLAALEETMLALAEALLRPTRGD
ncbi:hypothetical protein [Microbispora sp. NPDC049125]|uniref:hypothetical protein n=1 Tax=Microbispora sp. NPDC049125 TaxID=3154929 RepID=UPI0034673433